MNDFPSPYKSIYPAKVCGEKVKVDILGKLNQNRNICYLRTVNV